MPGGKRDGAGRKKGIPNRRTTELYEKAAAEGIMPLEYMLKVMRDEGAPSERRDWAAEKAAPFFHAKLSSVQVGGDDGGPIKAETRVVLTFD